MATDGTGGRPLGASGRRPGTRRARPWYISPDGFRELRHSCFLSRKACAEYLGVSLRTVRYWNDGDRIELLGNNKAK